MKDKLEVGMYVRTKSEIVQINKILNGVMEDTKGHLHFGDFIKASYNIIDLIEEGDYINGHLIEMFYDTYNPKTEEYEDILGVGIYTDANMDCIEEIRPLRTLDIKSIVTKEQFEIMSYKLGDD